MTVQRAPKQMSWQEMVQWLNYPIVDPVAQDYERAVEILREKGLTKGSAENEDGMCAGGLVVQATAERVGIKCIRIEGETVAADMELDGYDCVQTWNDEPERTEEQVIDRLEFAAKKLRDQGR